MSRSFSAPVAGPIFVTGRYTNAFAANGLAQVAAATGMTQSRLRIAPFRLDRSASFDRIGSVVTVVAASSTLRWVIYSDSNAYPGALLLDTGAVGDSASGTGLKEATISLTLGPGRYWTGAIPQGGNPTLQAMTGSPSGMSVTAAETVSSGGTATAYFTDSVTGAAPSTFPASAAVGSTVASIWLRGA